MTDMSTETLVTPQVGSGRTAAAPSVEYQVYFALIFAVALPGTVPGWARDAVLGREAAGKGPVARALCHAHTITPQIFRA